MTEQSRQTLARRKEIRERCEAATPGVWQVSQMKDKDGWSTTPMVAAVARGMGIFSSTQGGVFPAADQRFIAHSRTDLPALLDALDDVVGLLGRIVQAKPLMAPQTDKQAAIYAIIDEAAELVKGIDNG